MSRFNYRLFRMIEQMHNFRIQLIRTAVWGTNKNNTPWNGAVGFTVRHEVDLQLTPLRWSPERFGVYESTAYTYNVHVIFVFRHPRTAISAGNVFLQPFVTVVWLVTAAVGALCACLVRRMLLVERQQAERWTSAEEAAEPPADAAWSAAILMVLGILLQQGYDCEPRLLAGRIVALSALFLAMMLLQFYGAFIVGSLLMESPKTIRTLKQLYDSRLECGIDEVAYMRDIFNHLVESDAVRLYERRVLERDNLMSQDSGLELIRRGGFAFGFSDISAMYARLRESLGEKEVCELQEIGLAKSYECGPTVPNGSPLQELVKIE